MTADEFGDALQRLADFLEGGELTAKVAELEGRLGGANAQDAIDAARVSGFDAGLFAAATMVRERLGRISDVIHSAGICAALDEILEPGEVLVNRPSLAAGNDPSRPFDLETDRRVAEFKFSVWQGADSMRKRGLFKDLMVLAADGSGRRRELYVVGHLPIRFLRESSTSAAWALNKNQSAAAFFERRFGDPTKVMVSDFTARSDVMIVDLQVAFPHVFGPGDSSAHPPKAPRSASTAETSHTGKYAPLWRWLLSAEGDEVHASFGEIETILGFPLPASARKHPAHWSGYQGSAVARAIRDAGWRSRGLDIQNERIRFRRE